MKIVVSTAIKEICPQFRLAVISCDVKNSMSSSLLWEEIDREAEEMKRHYSLDQINKRAEIAATRKVYKQLGKDPNRYRPSAEAMCRRILRDIPLYRVDTLVDIINLISIRTGYSIGGFDADKIQGNVELGVGTENDEFEAIGRGILNIAGLPVYRDGVGGIGTPTSDNERTKITPATRKLTMIINDYSGSGNLQAAVDFSLELLKKYAQSEHFDIQIVTES